MYLRAFVLDVILKRSSYPSNYSDLIRTWYHYNGPSSPSLSPLGSLIHGRGEPKHAGLCRNFTFPATHLGWSTARKWILNDGGLSQTRGELDMQENTDRAGVCRSSEVTAPVIKDAAMYAIFPGSVSCLPSVGVWTHSWFKSWVRRVRVCVGCSCILVWILSSSGLLNGILSALLLIHFLALKNWWQRHNWAQWRGSKSAITLGVAGWLNYRLRFISSSCSCQAGGKDASLWLQLNFWRLCLSKCNAPW